MADRLADGLESQKVLPLAPRGRQFFAKPTHPQAESIGPTQVGFPGSSGSAQRPRADCGLIPAKTGSIPALEVTPLTRACTAPSPRKQIRSMNPQSRHAR